MFPPFFRRLSVIRCRPIDFGRQCDGYRTLRGIFIFYLHTDPGSDNHSDGEECLYAVPYDIGGMESRLDKGIRRHHFASDTPQNCRAYIKDEGISTHQFTQDVARKNHQRDAQSQSKQEEKKIPFGSARHSQDIIHRHGDIRYDDNPDCMPDRFANLFIFVAFGPFDQQLDRYPDDKRAAHESDELEQEEMSGKKGENHSENYRRSRPEDDALQTLFLRQRSDGHGNNHGVVSGQHYINDDNTDDGQKKFPCETGVP
jgi:hypothetical protein